jgi:hypothetical protein
MKGDGYGNAMPGRTITPNEAVTMVLRAIGYTDNASVLVGQWPANYVSLGQSLNLYAKVANDTNMNKASAAQMVYNVLVSQLVQVDANSTVKYLYDVNESSKTLLTENLNCERSGKRIVNYGDASKSKINLIPSVGAYGELYTSKADGEVVALTNVGTEFLSGRFMFKGDGTIDVFQSVDGTKYTLSSTNPDPKNEPNRISPRVWAGQFNTTGAAARVYASQNSAIFLNGEQPDSLTGTQCDDYVVYDPDGPGGNATVNQAAFLTIAAKVNGQTITDLRSVAVWVADQRGDDIKGDRFLYESNMYKSGDKKFNGHDFPLDVNNEADHYGYVLNGVDSLEDIAVDNVVYVYKNRSNKIARIDVGTATQSGAVTNVNAADSAATVGGTVLYYAPLGLRGVNFDKVQTPGNEGTALLDIYYRIYDFQLSDAFKGNFAVLLDSAEYFGNQVKIFDKTGSEVIYGFTSDFKVTLADGTVYTKDTATTAISYISSAGAKEQLIAYTLSGGKISAIRMGTKESNGDAKQGSVNKTGSLVTINGSARQLDSGALVYVEDGGDFSLGSVKDLLDKDIKKEFHYIFDEDGRVVKALIVNTGDAGAQRVFVMINTIPDGYDNGRIDIVNGISFADGTGAAAKSWNYANPDLHNSSDLKLDKYANGDPIPESVQRDRYSTMVQFSIGEDGVLKNAIRLADQNGLDKVDAYTDISLAPVSATLASPYRGGSNGFFDLAIVSGSGIAWVSFESDAVLYKVAAGSWTANPVNTSTLRDEDTTPDLYTFLKTDPKKAGYDVIIKQ